MSNAFYRWATEGRSAVTCFAIIGSRGYPNPERVIAWCTYIVRAHPDATFVSGGAKGPDSIGAAYLRKRGREVVEVLPDYDTHGRAAPLVRNTEIVRRCDRVVAFWDGRSNGTLDAIRKAVKMGKRVTIMPPVTSAPGET